MEMYIIFGVIIVGLIGMSVFNNKQRKKQQAQEQDRRNRICAGTTIITIGGIMGTVVSVDLVEKTYVLDSQGSLLKMDMRSIYQMQLPAEVEAQIAAEAAQEVARKEAEKKARKDMKKSKKVEAPVEEPAQEVIEEENKAE
ncbi:MAG: hypothetical protein E7358_07050 [Clostridiales bacterium]|nr:hypothetical protein [Clostridiales bacterium]